MMAILRKFMKIPVPTFAAPGLQGGSIAVSAMVLECLSLQEAPSDNALRHAALQYMVRPLRNCSIPYMNPSDLETGCARANQPRLTGLILPWAAF
jgi:hypothetical protein